jgi:hypothetical protein
MPHRREDVALLEAALLGYQFQLQTVNLHIAELKHRLASAAKRAPTAARAITPTTARRPQRKHRISPEGRARIAAAQRARWAKSRKKTMAAG